MRLRPGELAGPAGLNASSLAALAAALNATGVAADWNATDIASSFNTSALASALNASALVLNATAFAAASAVRAAAARASAASGDLLDGATPSGLVSAGAMHAGLLRHLNSTASLAAFLHVAGAIAGAIATDVADAPTLYAMEVSATRLVRAARRCERNASRCELHGLAARTVAELATWDAPDVLLACALLYGMRAQLEASAANGDHRAGGHLAFKLLSRDYDHAGRFASVTRTVVQLGGPLVGYTSIHDRSDEQVHMIRGRLWPAFNHFVQAEAAAGGQVDVAWDNFISLPGAKGFLTWLAFDVIFDDMLYLLASLVVIYIAIGLHTRSPFLATLGVVEILLSFPIALFFYVQACVWHAHTPHIHATYGPDPTLLPDCALPLRAGMRVACPWYALGTGHVACACGMCMRHVHLLRAGLPACPRPLRRRRALLANAHSRYVHHPRHWLRRHLRAPRRVESDLDGAEHMPRIARGAPPLGLHPRHQGHGRDHHHQRDRLSRHDCLHRPQPPVVCYLHRRPRVCQFRARLHHVACRHHHPSPVHLTETSPLRLPLCTATASQGAGRRRRRRAGYLHSLGGHGQRPHRDRLRSWRPRRDRLRVRLGVAGQGGRPGGRMDRRGRTLAAAFAAGGDGQREGSRAAGHQRRHDTAHRHRRSLGRRRRPCGRRQLGCRRWRRRRGLSQPSDATGTLDRPRVWQQQPPARLSPRAYLSVRRAS